MPGPPHSSEADAKTLARMRDEAEQLRTALEQSLEENARLIDDRDRLARRVAALARDLQSAHQAYDGAGPAADGDDERNAAAEYRSHADEELRVAFEELQVLAEELEVANHSLIEANRDLDRRVAERTREIAQVNTALTASDAAFRAIADVVPDMLWRTDRAGRVQWYNRRWYDHIGPADGDSPAPEWTDAIHPAERAAARSLWQRTVAQGAAYEREHRLRDRDGQYRWFLTRAAPMRDDRGDLRHWFGAATDIHGQRTALDALRHSEQRFRTLVEGIPQLVWRADAAGRRTWSSPQWTEFTGQTPDEGSGHGWLAALHPDDRAAVADAWAEADPARPFERTMRIFSVREGRHRHFQSRAIAVGDGRSGVSEWLGTSTDIDDILRLQQRQDVLVAELQHRTRNLMAVVQAVTMRTIRGSRGLDDFRVRIDDRLAALARVQGLLSRRAEGDRVTFDDLLREELSVHGAPSDAGADPDAPPRLSLDGPTGVPLPSRTVQTLALAIHELATNASKYGAFASPSGRLTVRWRIRHDPDHPPRLLVDWRECGIAAMPDAVTGPQGSGYGRELIERALPYQLGCRTSFAFERDGVHCTIDMPIDGKDMTRGED